MQGKASAIHPPIQSVSNSTSQKRHNEDDRVRTFDKHACTWAISDMQDKRAKANRALTLVPSRDTPDTRHRQASQHLKHSQSSKRDNTRSHSAGQLNTVSDSAARRSSHRAGSLGRGSRGRGRGRRRERNPNQGRSRRRVRRRAPATGR